MLGCLILQLSSLVTFYRLQFMNPFCWFAAVLNPILSLDTYLVPSSMMFDVYFVDLLALKEVMTDWQTDRLTDICLSWAAFAAENSCYL